MHDQHLVLIDGHHLMYRAYFAIPRTMVTSSGEQVNVPYGVASMLLNILLAEKPSHLLFCFDDGSETFRHQAFEGYKEGRAETPDDFYTQIPRVDELIAACGIQKVSSKEHEADDLIGSYACVASKEGFRTTIVSGDRDLFQLATDRIRIAIPHKAYQQQEYVDPQKIQEKFGVSATQIPAYKGLVGDHSDNLPGVHGIGPKAAESLLRTYGNLQAIYENLASIQPSWRAKLEQGREDAFFSEKMATLITNIPLPLSLEHLSTASFTFPQAREFFTALSFRSLERKLLSYERILCPSTPSSLQSDVPEQMSLF